MPSVLVVGGGGREHALVRTLQNAPSAPRVIAAPGNDAIGEHAERHPAASVDAWVELALQKRVDLVVVGPEDPLVAGLADRLQQLGVPVLGPTAAAARLEGSKTFSKAIMERAGVPTAAWVSSEDRRVLVEFAERHGAVAVKADGLARGKGVVVAEDAQAAIAAIDQLREAHGPRLVVEERLIGTEISVLALSDGVHLDLLPVAQDHKRVFDGDRGPNTGGMGAYSPVPVATRALLQDIQTHCLEPIVRTLAADGSPFIGVLYGGLMLTDRGPRVLEYNVRFGDPEAQAILPRIDTDLFELFRAAATGGLSGRPVPEKGLAAACVVMAAEGYPDAPVLGDAIEGLDRALTDAYVFHAGTKRKGDSYLTAGGRVLGVTGVGTDAASALAAAYRAVEQIRFRGAHYRRDIGAKA